MYSQVPSIKKIRGRNRVFIVEEGAAIPLHTDPQFVSIQEGSSVRDEDTKSEKKGGNVKEDYEVI